jgi:hypothetical protein
MSVAWRGGAHDHALVQFPHNPTHHFGLDYNFTIGDQPIKRLAYGL